MCLDFSFGLSLPIINKSEELKARNTAGFTEAGFSVKSSSVPHGVGVYPISVTLGMT